MRRRRRAHGAGAAALWLGLAAGRELAAPAHAGRLHDAAIVLQQDPRAWAATWDWGWRSRWRGAALRHRQVRADGCGAAALCAVLESRGVRVSQNLVWGMCRLPAGGTTLARLTIAARCLGQPAEARRETRLEALPLPAVVHLRRRHFVVLQQVAGERAVVFDPACGEVAVPLPRLRAEASGAVLVFPPGSERRR
jgi:hypothetical protein